MSCPHAPSPEVRSPGGNFRWIICGLLFCSVAVNYLDRLVLAILKKDLCRELGWSDADYGWITAAFSFAYAFGYLLGGRLIDRWGVKKGLPVFVTLWSCAAAAHGLCGWIGVEARLELRYPWFTFDHGFALMTLSLPMTAAGFMLARIALGLTEGGNFPGAIKAVAEWHPVGERALATGLFNAGTNVGAILCPIVVPWLYRRLGWESTFYITGATGFVWVGAWWWIYDAPERHRRLTPAELAHIRGNRPIVEERRIKVPWLSLLRHRPVWAFVIASILAGPAWGFYQFFVPDFLGRRFGIGTQEVGWWTGAFFALAAIGGVAGGWLAGKLLGMGWSVNAARKLSLLACAIAVVPVFLAPFAGSVWLAVVIVGIAGSAHQGWSANLFSVVSDTMPKQAISSVVGLGGFVSYFTGGFVNGLTGEILKATQESRADFFGLGDASGYLLVFAYFSGMYLVSLLAIQLLVPRLGVRGE